ncbi:MAG: DUF3352 domain-containing protein [Candidatus Omnitrophota bacterium]|nr:DUF3352 domain-containing protein [Candidatus Omnitrophota bacterium]
MNIKKIISVISLIVVLAVGIIFYLQVSKPVKVENLTDLVPSEALICIAGRDMDKTWQKIKNTEFYSKIINSPFLKDNPNVGALKDKVKQDWFSEDDILSVLGKEAVLGVFFRSLVFEKPDFDILLLSRLNRGTRAKELILSSLSRIKKDKLITSQRYKGYRVSTIKQAESKEGFSYLIFGDTLIMSNNLELIKQAVNLAKNDYKDSISQDGEFRRSREKLSDDYVGWLYLDIKKLKQLTKNLENPSYPEFNTGAMSSYFFEIKLLEGLAVKGWSYLDVGQTEDASFKAILDSLGYAKLDTIGFVPLNTALFSGGNFGDIKLLWPYIKEQLNNPFFKKGNDEEIKDSRQFFARLNTMLGFDLENDLLQYLGKEYAFGLSGFKEADIPLAVSGGKVRPFSLSLPEFFGCIQALDKDKINSLMQIIWQKMSDGINARIKPPLSGQDNPGTKNEAQEEEEAAIPPVYLETNNYSGVDIYALKFQPAVLLPLGINPDIFSPAYCFFGDYLVISSNDNLLKKIINTYQKKNLSLADSVKFSEIKHKLQPEFNSLFYINMEEIIGPVMKMVSSFTRSSGDDIENEEYKRGLAESVFIMDTLKSLKAVGLTGAYKDGFYEFYMYVPIGGL